jgi:hypothetical protein
MIAAEKARGKGRAALEKNYVQNAAPRKTGSRDKNIDA